MIHSLVHDAGSHGTGSPIDGLLAYHGTAAAFESFDLGMAAAYSSAPLAHLGIYFTPDRKLARAFCRRKWSKPRSRFREGARIITASLSIRRPRYMRAYEWIALSSQAEDVIAFRERLKLEGFDGVVVRPLDNDPTGELHVPQYVIFDPSQATIIASDPVRKRRPAAALSLSV